jgi:hypothetical protein
MRKLEFKMLEYIDSKLAGNGSAQLAIETKSVRELFAYVMESLVGIREIGGNNKGPLVELIQETVGGHSAEAWCMSTIQTAIAYAELKCGIISRFPVTEHCMTAWVKAPAQLHVKFSPLKGAIAIWQYGKSQNGHTGMFVEAIEDKSMSTVEGNTNSGTENGTVIRDGGGVYKNRRSMIPSGEMRLLGFLKPF